MSELVIGVFEHIATKFCLYYKRKMAFKEGQGVSIDIGGLLTYLCVVNLGHLGPKPGPDIKIPAEVSNSNAVMWQNVWNNRA